MLALVAVQVVIAALLLEVVIRIIGPRTAMRKLLYQPAEVADLRSAETVEQLMSKSMIGFAPFSESYGFVLNSRSLRTKEYDEVKPPGTIRVLAFGDSFTWASGGLPHEDHWTVTLERLMNRTAGPPVEVLRLGVPATGPDFQLRLWQLEGAHLDADIVVVGFFVGNDFVDHQGRAATRDLRKYSLTEALSQRWMSFRLAHNLIRVARDVSRHGRPPKSKALSGRTFDSGGYALPEYSERFRRRRPTFTNESFLDIEARRFALCRNDNRAVFESLLMRVGDTLETFHDEVEEAGARFVVMIIPDEYRVDGSLTAQLAAAAGLGPDDFDLDRPARRLTEFLSARGIEVLDLTPAFVRRGKERKLYRPRDTHWNRRGNTLAGGLLARYLDSGARTSPMVTRSPAISTNSFETGAAADFSPGRADEPPVRASDG